MISRSTLQSFWFSKRTAFAGTILCLYFLIGPIILARAFSTTVGSLRFFIKLIFAIPELPGSLPRTDAWSERHCEESDINE